MLFRSVNVIFNSISGAKVPATVQLQIGIGTLDSSGACSASNLTLAKASSNVALSVIENPGTYCLSLADVGNLLTPASVAVSVAHP